MKRSVALFVLVLAACSFTEKNDPSTWSAAKLYRDAKEALDSGAYDQAIKLYETLEARFPYGRYSQQAQLEIAYCHWKDSERASAIAAVDRFIKMYPNHANADYAWYLKGLVNFNDQYGILSQLTTPDMSDRDPKSTRESFVAFKEVVARFPDSKYAEDAAARMRYLVNALASHEVHVARYYMKRGAYLAAANRAQYAIAHYAQAPALEEAVFMLVLAYDRLGMTDLRDAADRVMRTNFPDSRYLKPGGERRAKDVPWWRLWDPDW